MHHRSRSIAFLCTFLVLAGLGAGTSVAQTGDSAAEVGFRLYRIRPFGDSITMGWEGGYRADLLRNQPNKLPFLMVGGLTVNSPAWMSQIGEEFHDGYSGFRIDQLVPIAWQPRLADIILVHAGTNDILQGAGGEATAQALNQLLVSLLLQNRQAMILVAQILPIYWPPGRDAVVQQYNSRIPDIVAQFRQWGRTVQVVDMYSGMTSQDLADGVHPTPSGYRKMAERWKNAINALPALALAAIPGADGPP